MKKIIIYLLLPFFLLLTGCEKYVSQDDVDPNNPTTATMQVLLPTVEVAIFATYTGEISRTSGMWVQHFNGATFQSQERGNYSLSENDVQNDFSTIYSSAIPNGKDIIKQATALNAPYYKGIAEICNAMMFGIATDFWGDVPEEEAGLGVENLTPHYESQEVVLAHIQSMLSDAIVNLSKPVAANSVLPGDDDFIHKGDPAAWIATAWILKARYHNRLSQRDPAGSATSVLNDLSAAEAAGLIDNSLDAYAVVDGASNINTWYDFDHQRANYIKTGATLIDTMVSLADPRLPFYAAPDTGGGFSGSPIGSDNIVASSIGPGFADITTPLPLVTYTESRFLKAEASLRAGNTAGAQTAFTEALNSAMTFTGIDPVATAAYIAANGTLTGGNELNQIMFQKWIAMYTQPEAFADWRRTNIPALTPNPSGVQATIPVRFPTEQNERLYNPNAIVITNLTTNVWWDF